MIMENIDYIMNYPQGFWQVDNKKFINKYDALLESTRTGIEVKYIFFDSAFRYYKKDNLGKYTLNELYKHRAQQLRDKYDYLILYFSGGADSYNVLRTFIDNDIKLDEVCVKWCSITKKANVEIYTPNQADSTAENYLSEWDYAIFPVLNGLRKNNPEIHIEIVDWMPTVEKEIDPNVFNLVNHWHDLELPAMVAFSPNEAKMTARGKRVGAIYGVDKPRTFFREGNAYMWFSDGATTMGVPNPINVYGTEYFYWTPNMPLLAYEMARVAIVWQLSDRNIFNQCAYTQELKDHSVRTDDSSYFKNAYQYQESNLRSLLYTTWTNRFQSDKPIIQDRRDKHKWIYENDQLKSYRESFNYIQHSLMKQLDSKLYLDNIKSNNTKAYLYKHTPSPIYLVLENYQEYIR